MKAAYLLIVVTIAIILPLSCTRNNNDISGLHSRVDSLEKRLSDSYKPGFGEFMSSIQVHHAKLWFAGTNNNWELADFEIHEIKENIEGIQKYQAERKESQFVMVLNTGIDSISTAIQQKNTALFKTGFQGLTNDCNNCHKQVNYGFNDVKIPDTPPFSNQIFKSETK